MEVREVFDASPRSTLHVLMEVGTGFYIPGYQREYTWDHNNISRLLEDIGHGIHSLLANENAITFIGTLIVIHDTKHESVEPQDKEHVASKVLVVIDGQQRLTTLLLMNSILHNEISKRAATFASRQDDASRWLYDKTQETLPTLNDTLFIDMRHGDEGYRYYPRMIRSYVDVWSRRAVTAKYVSPIARYLKSYSTHCENTDSKQFTYKVEKGVEGDVDDKDHHRSIVDNTKTFRTRIRRIISTTDSDVELPTVAEMLSCPNFQRTLFGSELSESVRSMLRSDDRAAQLFNLLVMTKYLLERVAVTHVTVKDEDYAFDMFEALNTTGEPLTAFETFRPKVVQVEAVSDYKTSSSKQHMGQVERYLDKYSKAQDRQRATSDLLVPFALAETGFKLAKRLSDQRRYLRDEFEKIKELPEKRAFVRHLAHAAIFMRQGWDGDADLELPLRDAEVSTLCLDYLRLTNHNITIALLIRFFSAARVAPGDRHEVAVKDFEEILKSVVAFSVLWRGSRPSSDNIDAHYRELMSRGFAEIGVPAFCRRPADNGPADDVHESVGSIKKALRWLLTERGGVKDKSHWVGKAADLNVYAVSQPLTRLILFAALHDTDVDPDLPGCPKRGREGLLPLLCRARWKSDLTVEHVAPSKRPETGWQDMLYLEGETVDRLGNLTLLPQRENSSVGNRSWTEKRIIYRALSATNSDDLATCLAAADEQGIAISQNTSTVIEQSQYLPHLRSLASYTGEWTADVISQRSKVIAEFAWDRLSAWLAD